MNATYECDSEIVGMWHLLRKLKLQAAMEFEVADASNLPQEQLLAIRELPKCWFCFAEREGCGLQFQDV